ncbi:MAG: hypothetical protein IPN37_01485 [Betaproteobacteria bacterium]|nr:hypothetical protein [Betaproteobacteria bacterium]
MNRSNVAWVDVPYTSATTTGDRGPSPPVQRAIETIRMWAGQQPTTSTGQRTGQRLDLSQRLIEFRVKGENHPPNTVALQLYSTSTNGFLQYDLTASDLDGEWRHLSLSLGRFSSYGTNPDLQAIDLVRFRAIGDAGGAALTGSMLVNDLVARSVAEPGVGRPGPVRHAALGPRRWAGGPASPGGAGRQLTPLIKVAPARSSAGVWGFQVLLFAAVQCSSPVEAVASPARHPPVNSAGQVQGNRPDLTSPAGPQAGSAGRGRGFRAIRCAGRPVWTAPGSRAGPA